MSPDYIRFVSDTISQASRVLLACRPFQSAKVVYHGDLKILINHFSSGKTSVGMFCDQTSTG